ncbi:hypothetical protein TURU_150127 [Turdus rufiventris]|nr:hypothetical protein TURU_150127 [Turdus rufiventris]
MGVVLVIPVAQIMTLAQAGLLQGGVKECPRRTHSRQNFFTVMYQIHIQILMMTIREIDIAAKSSRGEDMDDELNDSMTGLKQEMLVACRQSDKEFHLEEIERGRDIVRMDNSEILCPKNLIKANLAPSSDRQCAGSLNNEQEQLMPVKVVSPWTFDRGSCGNVENVLCTSQAL